MRTEQTGIAVATGARIRGLIAEKNLTRHEVADALHLSVHALGRRLRGDVPFNIDEVHTLAKLFTVPLTRLLDEVA